MGTIAAKILCSSLFDTLNVNKVLMSIYMTDDNFKLFLSKIWHTYSVFDKYRIVLLASEGCLNVDLLLLNPASEAGIYIYPTRMTLMD
jgi:hypothetical protein